MGLIMSKMVDTNRFNIDSALDWVQGNCASFIKYDSLLSPLKTGGYEVTFRFYFDDDNEALLFQLRWA